MKSIRRTLCPLLLAGTTLLSSCIVETPPHPVGATESTAPSETESVFVTEPAATVEPEATVETEATVEPETTAESETAVDPQTTDEPEATPTTDEPEVNTDEAPSEGVTFPEGTRYLQFPLTDADDTASYVSLPDMTADGPKAIEFFVLPTDTDAPALTSAWRWILPRDGDVNVRVISYKDEKTYGFIIMLEGTSVTEANGTETRSVKMECTSVDFFDDKASMGLSRYFFTNGGGSSAFQYTEQNRTSTLLRYRHDNLAALKRTEDLLYTYNDPAKYEFTILYSYVNGTETINTPVDSIPDFPFTLFHEYGFVD